MNHPVRSSPTRSRSGCQTGRSPCLIVPGSVPSAMDRSVLHNAWRNNVEPCRNGDGLVPPPGCTRRRIEEDPPMRTALRLLALAVLGLALFPAAAPGATVDRDTETGVITIVDDSRDRRRHHGRADAGRSTSSAAPAAAWTTNSGDCDGGRGRRSSARRARASRSTSAPGTTASARRGARPRSASPAGSANDDIATSDGERRPRRRRGRRHPRRRGRGSTTTSARPATT